MSRSVSDIVTFTGRVVDPLNLDPDKVNIIDIAHSLSLQCRFTGHVKWHYSVGHHSILCAQFAHELWGKDERTFALLMHDASETYCADLARPIKRAEGLGEAYREVEDRIQATIAAKFGIPFPFPDYVGMIDNALLLAEQQQLMPRFRHIPAEDVVYEYAIPPRDPAYVEGLFLGMYEGLTGETPKR